MIERVDRLAEPPHAGRFYLVPTVFYRHVGHAAAEWPVMGPKHEDAEHLNFPAQHYHVDCRFLSVRQRHWIGDWGSSAAIAAARHPISEVPEWGAMPVTVLRKLKCRTVDHDYPEELVAVSEPFRKMHEAFAGQKCAHGKAGWICPHRNAALGSIVPHDGVIVCPLHGLRIDAATGMTLPPLSEPEPAEVPRGLVPSSSEAVGHTK